MGPNWIRPGLLVREAWLALTPQAEDRTWVPKLVQAVVVLKESATRLVLIMDCEEVGGGGWRANCRLGCANPAGPSNPRASNRGSRTPNLLVIFMFSCYRGYLQHMMHSVLFPGHWTRQLHSFICTFGAFLTTNSLLHAIPSSTLSHNTHYDDPRHESQIICSYAYYRREGN